MGFGRGVVASAAAGDLRHNGFSDLVLGAAGELQVFYGSPQGLPPRPDWSWRPKQADGGLTGSCVAILGHLDGSPYPVVAVSSMGGRGYGLVYLFHCGPKGIEAQPWKVLADPAKGTGFGERLVSAGDLYGDGYSCLAISDYAYGHERGAVYVYRGGPQGPGLTPVWRAVGAKSGDWFGYSLSGPGDLDGDGYADLAIGSKNCDGSCLNFVAGEAAARLALKTDSGWKRAALLPRAGRMAVYYGSKKGLLNTPGLVMQGVSNEEMFAYSLAPAAPGPDRRARLLVSSLGWRDRRGLVQLFEGSAQGQPLKPLWKVEGDLPDQGFGDVVQWIPAASKDAAGEVLVAGLAKGCAWVVDPQGSDGLPRKRALFSDPPVDKHLNEVLGWGGDFWGNGTQEVYVWLAGIKAEIDIIKIK